VRARCGAQQFVRADADNTCAFTLRRLRRGSTQSLERMREASRKRTAGATIFAIVLAWLGVAGILNAVVWPLLRNSELMKSAPPGFVAQFPPALGSWWLSLLMLAYGVTAFRAAKALWRLSPSAVGAYLWWAAAVVLGMFAFSVSMPGASVLADIAIFALVVAFLAVGWLLTRRLVQT
jgi:hypothetical protein